MRKLLLALAASAVFAIAACAPGGSDGETPTDPGMPSPGMTDGGLSPTPANDMTADPTVSP